MNLFLVGVLVLFSFCSNPVLPLVSRAQTTDEIFFWALPERLTHHHHHPAGTPPATTRNSEEVTLREVDRSIGDAMVDHVKVFEPGH
jgi:hypothetical protein